MSAVVELRGVWRSFRTAVPVHAVRDLSLMIDEGEFVSIVGASGSGKSTLLGLVGLLDRPTRGEILLEGRRTTELGDRERSQLRAHKIGFVFQQFHLIPYLSALENVATALLYRGISPPQRVTLASQALERVGLRPRGDHRPNQLSGGEQQRVAIARAIVARPTLLLADEPTGNLDSASAARIVELLASLVDAASAVVIVTHDPAVAERTQRRITMVDGSTPTL